ncbi:MAG: hypothetical protein KAI81_04335 [Candidatus Marinimicrobia bacterium]|nr:hypothetical protein [Candidatus Neomarinimicrobiota bacterium]
MTTAREAAKARTKASITGSSISSSSSSSSSTVIAPRVITDDRTWKGDPNDTVAIEVWKKSFEPGYVPQIISPRDSGGKYTSDPNKTESYITMDKETHAKEIAISLQKEPIIPTSIIDYFVKTLGGVKNELITPPPTATTLTKTKEDEDTSRNLTSLTPNKYAAIVGALLVVIFGSLYLGSTK